MKWDPAFKVVDPPSVTLSPLSEPFDTQYSLPGYRNLHLSNPAWENLPSFKKNNEGWLDHFWRWDGQIDPLQRGPTTIWVRNSTGERKQETVFCKITHILDPIRWVRGKYSDLPGGSAENQKAHKAFLAKKSDPMNQAYVEALTYFCCSRLREKNMSPHFPLFYGSFSAEADHYKLNISDDFDYFKNYKWFWNGYDSKKFKLCIENGDHETDSVKEEWTRRPSFLEEDDSDKDSNSDSTDDESLDVKPTSGDESGSLHSADDLSFQTGSTSEEDDLSTNFTEPSFFLEVDQFPVILMFLEKSDGVMDDLLSNRDLVSVESGTPEWEAMWAAWLFQILAALCAVQHTLSLTHNDLHTNNIVFIETDQEFLYYQKRDGTTWKVPTYGKLFRIIDFGRAIFRLKQKVIYSDDFCEGNDAATQYNFGPLRDSEKPELGPNPSFDLARLAVSLFEGIFPEEPPRKKGGKVLSEEEGLVVKETESDLFNVLWSWMVTDFGENILINSSGEEKYPDFDLYTIIAQGCHDAIPAKQLEKKPFSHFRILKNEIPTGQVVYSLFF